MATKTDAPQVVSKTPPPMNRGPKGSKLPADYVAGMLTQLEAGEWACDDRTFDTPYKARSAARVVRRAVCQLPECPFKETDIKTRVWEEPVDSGAWVFGAKVKDEANGS